jgi:hypothetical protein
MAISGQKTVTAAGTAEALGAATVRINGPLMVRALDTNTGTVAVGDSSLEMSNGMRLAKNEYVIFTFVTTLAQLYVDSAVNGEGVCWLLL